MLHRFSVKFIHAFQKTYGCSKIPLPVKLSGMKRHQQPSVQQKDAIGDYDGLQEEHYIKR